MPKTKAVRRPPPKRSDAQKLANWERIGTSAHSAKAALWVEYERRKRAYELEHPYSTPLEWSSAMQRIARELGI